MTDKRLKSFLHPIEGIDSVIFIKFLYLLMDSYMYDMDNTPDRCIESQGNMEQHIKNLAGSDELSSEEEDLINELETAYIWYGIYAGLEFCSMLQREMTNISEVARRIHPDNKV